MAAKSPRKRSGIHLGLERVKRVLALLGHPEEDFAAVLIAGTNGKGSVSALVESALRDAGYKTGLFTSPHLASPRERVRVSGDKISESDWRRGLARVQSTARRGRVPLTVFEEHTLAAFGYFSRQRVDIAVVEVGLGGRLDATNALPVLEATAVTSIGHDHMDWLGPTLRHVLMEKLGVCRPGTSHVQALAAPLEKTARDFCREHHVPVQSLGREIRLRPGRLHLKARRQSLNVFLPGRAYKKLSIGLLGRHQLNNAALAVALLDILRQRGWRLTDAHVRRGLARAKWPGRFQILRTRPAPVVLDGAHNLEGVRSLVQAWSASSWGRRTATLIFGCLKEKDAAVLAKILAPLAQRVLAVPLAPPRGRSAEELARFWRPFTPVEACRDFAEAWRRARQTPRAPVLVTGSLYLIGEALRYFKKIP